MEDLRQLVLPAESPPSEGDGNGNPHDKPLPPRPDKVLLREGSVDNMGEQYRNSSHGSRESFHDAVPNVDGADLAIGGSERFHRSGCQRLAAASNVALQYQYNPYPTGFVPVPMFHMTAYPFQYPMYPCQRAHTALFPRSPRSEDAMEVVPSSGGPGHDQENQLRRQLDEMAARLLQAEERAEASDRLAASYKKMLQPGADGVGDGTNSLADKVAKLQKDKKRLESELSDAQDHIFSLQSGLKVLTPKEVRTVCRTFNCLTPIPPNILLLYLTQLQDFDDLVNDISEWVEKFMIPITEDASRRDWVLTHTKKYPGDARDLKKFIHHYPDIEHGIGFPDTDIDVMIAVVMRFLHDNVFQKMLIGCVSEAISYLSFIESSMQNNVDPERGQIVAASPLPMKLRRVLGVLTSRLSDLYARRAWLAEAYNAIICTQRYKEEREYRMGKLADHLGDMLKIFRKENDDQLFKMSCREACIRPAVILHEKFLMSIHHFYVDLNPYLVWNQARQLVKAPDLLDHLGDLHCEDLMQNRRALNLARADPPPTRENLWQNLDNVMTVSPAVLMRQIGRGSKMNDPVVVRKQHILVAYATPEKKQDMYKKTPRPLINAIFNAQWERYEKPSGDPWTTIKGIMSG